MARPRNQKRASSRAHTPCPHCGKQLHGAKGLKAHIAQAHAAPAEARGQQ